MLLTDKRGKRLDFIPPNAMATCASGQNGRLVQVPYVDHPAVGKSNCRNFTTGSRFQRKRSDSYSNVVLVPLPGCLPEVHVPGVVAFICLSPDKVRQLMDAYELPHEGRSIRECRDAVQMYLSGWS